MIIQSQNQEIINFLIFIIEFYKELRLLGRLNALQLLLNLLALP